jgi:hypothetical protein
MPVRYFLDLPVYRITEDRYYNDRAAFVDRILFPHDASYSEQRRVDEKKNPGSLAGIRDHFEKAYGGCWRYNEIIGYIRLHFLGSQIRGEYYGINRRRIVRTRTRQLEYMTWKLAPEVDIPLDATDSDIFAMTPSLLPWDLISTGENSIDLRCRRQSQQRCRSDRHEPLERRAVSNGSFMLSGWIPACRTLETLAALDSVRGTFACETYPAKGSALSEITAHTRQMHTH